MEMQNLAELATDLGWPLQSCCIQDSSLCSIIRAPADATHWLDRIGLGVGIIFGHAYLQTSAEGMSSGI